MIEKPLVSVVITTFNRKNLLSYAIKSVLNQTYQNFEIIVINDFGEDVWDVIEEFQTDKIRYISHVKNMGLSAARNSAIKISRGDILCYLDDDDMFMEVHLERLVDVFVKEQECEWTYTEAYYITEKIEDKERREISKRKFIEDSTFSNKRLLIANFIPINALAHKKSVIDKVGGFNESLTSHEDWDMLIRISKQAIFYPCKNVTVEVRHRIDSNDNMLSGLKGRFYEIYKKIYGTYPSNDLCIRKKRQQILHLFIKEKVSEERQIQNMLMYIIEKLKLCILQVGFLLKYRCWDKECEDA